LHLFDFGFLRLDDDGQRFNFLLGFRQRAINTPFVMRESFD